MAPESMDPIPPPRPSVFELPPEPPPYVIPPAPVPPPLPEPPAFPEPTHMECALAGLESGIFGSALMILWFALDSLVANQYWWAPLNLWGSGLYGNVAFRTGLGTISLAGAALILFLGALAGAAAGLFIGNLRRYNFILAASLAAGVLWYGVLQLLILRGLNPLIWRMTPQPTTMLAHLLFAVVLTRIPRRGKSLAIAWRDVSGLL